MINRSLVDYECAVAPELQPIRAALYEYVLARDGVYIRAAKPDLKVCFRIAHCQVKGLQRVDEAFEWQLPRVPVAIVEKILVEARQAALGDLEKLFHLRRSPGWNLGAGEWVLEVPEQEQSAAACRSLDDESRNRAQIELHSHHNMPAFFSGTDDRDEQGFRIFGVIGEVLEAPQIRFRVGVYGYRWEVPAEWICELPDTIEDLAGR